MKAVDNGGYVHGHSLFMSGLYHSQARLSIRDLLQTVNLALGELPEAHVQAPKV